MTLSLGVALAVRSHLPANLPLEVPVAPDRDTAHQWLLEELSRPEYATSPSLLERFLDWLQGLFDGLPSIGGGGWQLPLLVVAAIVVLGGIAWWVAGPVRVSRRARVSAVVLHDDTRSSDELRAAADGAAAAGRWDLAVAERFRAVVRALEERVILDERAGRTAQEAAAAAGVRLPSLDADLHHAARLFDDVCYGRLPAGPDDDVMLRSLDSRAAALRPLPTAVAAP